MSIRYSIPSLDFDHPREYSEKRRSKKGKVNANEITVENSHRNLAKPTNNHSIEEREGKMEIIHLSFVMQIIFGG